MVVRIRTELTGKNMGIIYNEHCKDSVPLGGNASWASVIVDDDNPSIVPWSIIFSCFLIGTTFTETDLGHVELPNHIIITDCRLRLAVMPSFSDLKYHRWRLFDECEL